MTSSVSACNQKGKACIFFELEEVQYNQSQCLLLMGNQQEIKIIIRGQRTQNRSSVHNYELEVRETGGQSFAEFALQSDPLQSFFPNAKKDSGTLDTAADKEIIFLVRKTQTAPSHSAQKIVVHCTFGHGFPPDRWCTAHHQASIVITLV